jgi:hypothetical protein
MLEGGHHRSPRPGGGPAAVSPNGGTVYISVLDFVDGGSSEFATFVVRA